MQKKMQFDTIDDLFAAVRASDDVAVDDNFTKMVINQLPESPKRVDTKLISLDMLAAVFGGVLALLWVDFNAVLNLIWGQGVDASGQLLNTWSVAASETAAVASSATPLLMASIALVVISVASLAAWILVEKPSWLKL